jgi:hypothetical protein
MFRFLWGVAALALGGCWYSSSVRSDGGAGVRTMRDIEAADRCTSPEDARRQLADRTSRHLFAGTSQIYYTTADGRVFLWSPDEPRLFAGDWKVERQPYPPGRPETAGQQRTVVCFRYPQEAIHPVMRQGRPGAEWYCLPAGGFLQAVKESLAGDVFGLANRSDVPFVLGRYGTTLAALRARLRQG